MNKISKAKSYVWNHRKEIAGIAAGGTLTVFALKTAVAIKNSNTTDDE